MLQQDVKDIFLKGYVANVEKREETWRVTIDIIDSPTLPKRVRLTSRHKLLPFKTGEKIYVLADLIPIPSMLSVYGFNFKRHLYFQGIGALGQMKMIVSHEQGQKPSFVNMRQNHISESMSHAFTPHIAGILKALVIGDRTSIPDDIRQDFTHAGVAHVLAISGLHLSIIAGFVFLLSRRFLSLFPPIAERFPIKKWAAIIVLPISLFYLLISGCGIPAQRAFIMISFVMVAILLDRRPFSLHTVALAAMAVLFITPESIVSASFQLSFAAVIGLIAFYESESLWTIREKLSTPFKWLTYPLGILTSTVIATLATTPFTLATFSTYTLQSIPGNLVAIPLMGIVIMPALFLFVLFDFFGFHSYGTPFLEMILKKSTQFLIDSAHIISRWPGANMASIEPPPLFLSFVSLGGLWLCLWRGSLKLWGLLGIAIGFSIYFLYSPPQIMMSYNMIGLFKDGKLFTLPQNRSDFKVSAWEKAYGIKSRSHFTSDVFITFLKDQKLAILTQQDYLPSYLSAICNTYDLVISAEPVTFFCDKHRAIQLGSIAKENLYIIQGPTLSIKKIQPAQRPWETSIKPKY